MNKKILSLIVPTYNMEAYLCRCLDSVTDASITSAVEVIVVNDGSKDNSLNIAKEYEQKRPDIVRIIDKKNGNYGSCVNAALEIATGKYIKMLDADDWYDTSEFIKLIEKLENIDCDLFVTHYQKVYNTGEIINRRYDCSKWENGLLYDVDDIFKTNEFDNLQMHQIGYRTSVLRDMHYKQTEGISYTDYEWTYMPLYHVEKVAFVDANVYRYFLGREGQTMDSKVLNKCLGHELISLESMLKFKSVQGEVISPNLARHLSYATMKRAFMIYIRALVYMSDDDFSKFDLKKLDELLLVYSKEDYVAVEKYDARSFIIRHWRKTKSRYYSLLRLFVKTAMDIYYKF